MTGTRLMGSIGVVVVSLLLAFFGVLLVLFSDRGDATDTVNAFAYVGGLYLVASAIVHGVDRSAGWTWVAWLAAPGVLFGLLFSLSDGSLGTGYTWGIFATVVLATAGGRAAVRAFQRRPNGSGTAKPG